MGTAMDYQPKAVTVAEMPARYAELCALRDATNALNAPIEAELAEVNAQIEALRVQAESLAAQIDDNRGRADWIALKKEIGALARVVSRAA